VGSRADEYQQHGGNGDQEIAGGSDKSRDGGYYEAMRGVSPNFVHACDASLAVFTINACAAEDIEVATNHDCFSMLACDAPRVREIVREQFVRLHEPNLLEQIRDSAAQAGAENLPPVPDRGELDLRAVLRADYFVC
jgi:DNA-directed RNA polymerase